MAIDSENLTLRASFASTLKECLPTGVRRFLRRGWRCVRPRAWIDLFDYDHSPLTLPWFGFARGTKAIDEVHRIALRYNWENVRWRHLVRALLWPLRSLWLACRSVREYGRYVKRVTGVGIYLQAQQQLMLAYRWNVPPEGYYLHRLFLANRRKSVRHLVQHHEICRLLQHLNAGDEVQYVADKQLFYRRCVSSGLPTIPIIAVVDAANGVQWLYSTENRLPRIDLFMKPLDSCSGDGVERLEYRSRDDSWWVGCRWLREYELIEHVSQLAESRPIVIQPRVSNGADTRRFSLGGLCTVRIVTCRDAEGCIHPLLACLRMPCQDASADNFAAGGIAAPVDICSGKLGTAFPRDIRRGEFARHPDTRAEITGAMLNTWEELLALALRAHCSFALPTIGWDVAHTGDGAVLVEGNDTWGVVLAQLPSGIPLDNSDFAAWYLNTLQVKRRNSE